MKLKYFMRGLGIGIIFGAIVMLAAAAGKTDKEKLSNEEIIKRAEKLGMVMATDTDADAKTVEEVISTTEKTTEATETEEKTEVSTEETTTEEITTEEITTTEAQTTEEKKTTESTTESKKEKNTEDSHNTYTEATITVTGGMESTEVAAMLEKAEIIKDAEDFDNYLVTQGISNKIQINTFKLNSNMTYEEIAKIITTPKND